MSIPLLAERKRSDILGNDFVVAAAIAVVLTGLTFTLAYAFGWITAEPNWFEVAGSFLNYGATYLSIKQRRLAYTLGFVASAGFAIAYFQYGLLASSILSLYLVGQLIYGYFRWGPDGNPRPVHHLQWRWTWAYALATAGTYAGAVVIVTALGGSFAFWDAAILVLTILSQFLLDNKVIESWYVWVLVNIIGIGLYFTAGAPFAAMQQLIFLFANVWGFLAWRKTMLADREYSSPSAVFGRDLVRGADGIKRLDVSSYDAVAAHGAVDTGLVPTVHEAETAEPARSRITYIPVDKPDQHL